MKVKVRIAVAVSSQNDWFAVGWDNADTAMDTASKGRVGPSKKYWLTAELDAPDRGIPPEIEATVEEAKDE